MTTLTLNTRISFPAAYGAAYDISGGRGGTVVHVTNLNNSGSGSFRDACSVSNRIVVFDVSGIINLTSHFGIADNVTILGSTAPQGGVVVDGDRLYTSQGTNIIIEGVSFIGGNDSNGDALTFERCNRILLMNCGFRYGTDESLDLDAQGTTANDRGIITVQWCLFGEGDKAMIVGDNGGTIIGGVSFLGNAGSNMGYRLPKSSGPFDVEQANNVWHNFYYLISRFDDQAFRLNHQYNIYQAGSDTGNPDFNFALRTENTGDTPSIYSRDNFIDASIKLSSGNDNFDDWEKFPSDAVNEIESGWFVSTPHSFSWRPWPLKTVESEIMADVDQTGAHYYVNDSGVRGSYHNSLDSLTITQIQTDSSTARLSSGSYGAQPTSLPTNTRGGSFYVDDSDLPQFFIDAHAGVTGASSVVSQYTFTNYDNSETYTFNNTAGYTALEVYHAWVTQQLEFLLETGEVSGDTTYNITSVASGVVVKGKINGGSIKVITN